MGKPYSEELDQVERTLKWCAKLDLSRAGDVLHLGTALRLVCVGSGGSYTAAEFAVRLCEETSGRTATALTPLEYLQRAPRLGPHVTLLLSAEGKNSDARMAAAAALGHARATSVLTFRTQSPLLEILEESSASQILAVDTPWGKDGYLATNSLVATFAVLARLMGSDLDLGAAGELLTQARRTLPAQSAVQAMAAGAQIIALHGNVGAVAAVDLESKFAEAALGSVQRVDFRQFAHGRHIQLTQGPAPAVAVAFVSTQELDLWAEMRALLPHGTPTLTFTLTSQLGPACLAGLLCTFALVEAVGRGVSRDPGAPPVPDYARRIHGMQAAQYLSLSEPAEPGNKKITLLRRMGWSWSGIEEALDEYLDQLARSRIRALVLDFDGTCCETALRREGMDIRIAQQLQRLLDGQVPIAFASGRGDSLHDDLRKRLTAESWPRVLLGCHSGSTMVRLSDVWQDASVNPQFDTVAQELAEHGIDPQHGFAIRMKAQQFTIESDSTVGTMQAYLVADQLARARPGWRVFRSSHSVDMLGEQGGKRLVLDRLTEELSLPLEDHLLCIGDRGEAHGNDSELLGSVLSLSVDGVSADPQTCWFLGDALSNASERALAYLQALVVPEPGLCSFNPLPLQAWRGQALHDIAIAKGGRT